MRFDRGLRSAMMKPYPIGHVAAETNGFNGEDPQCQFGGVKDAGVWLGEQNLPSIIGLQVRLTSLWVENEAASAKLADNGACPLYPPQSVLSKVRVDPTGTGYYQKASGEGMVPFIGERFLDYRLELPEPHLYQKEFLEQPQGRTIHWVPQGVPFLWAYGAAQMEDDVHPLVITLEALQGETIVRPTSLLSWRERGILPGDEGNEELTFQDIFEKDQTRTLMESIEMGMAKIGLVIGVDERGQPVKIPYRSYQLSKGSLYYSLLSLVLYMEQGAKPTKAR